jgi:anti-anti-sigma regulatory factor
MPNDSLEQNSGRLALDPVQTLRTIEATRELLIQNIGKSAQLSLDCSAIDEADISLVQVLISARKTAQQYGTTLRLDAVSDALRSALERAGIPGATGDDPFWNGAAP